MAASPPHACAMDSCMQRLQSSTQLFLKLEKPSPSSSYMQNLRLEIVEFILEMSTYVPQTKIAKDTAVQMFDTYLAKTLQNNNDPSLSTCCTLKMIAFVCYVLSIKLHVSYLGFLEDFKRKASRANNMKISEKTLSETEALIMNEIAFDVTPHSSSVHMYRLIFQSFFDSAHRFVSQDQRRELCLRIEGAIDECHKSTHFLQYSASTIAIACFVFCSSSLPFDCNEYITSIPDVFFATHHACNISPSAMDVTSCVDAISANASSKAMLKLMDSPSSPFRKGVSFTPKDVVSLSRDISNKELLSECDSPNTKKRRMLDSVRAKLTCENRTFSLGTMFDTILKSVAVCESSSLDDADWMDLDLVEVFDLED